MKRTVTVLYSCTGCDLNDAPVKVPARGAEGVVEWTRNTLVLAISRDHQRRSPGCPAREMKYVKIPVEGVDRIGDPPPSTPEGP